MKLAVIGAGGVGGLFGGLMADAGQDVHFIARGRHLAAIRENGLRIESSTFGNRKIAARATDDPRDVGPVDAVLVCVKTYDLDAAAALLQPMLAGNTLVIGLQNGVDDTCLAQAASRERLVVGVAQVVAWIESPGTIRHLAAGRLVLGANEPGPKARVGPIVAALKAAGIDAIEVADIEAARWRKFAFIVAQAGLTCLTRHHLGHLTSSPNARAVYGGLLDEVLQLAKRREVHLPPSCRDELMATAEKMAKEAPTTTSSMARDLADGRRLELSALHGEVVRLGRSLGVPTPLSLAVLTALEPHAEGARTRP